MWKLFEIHKVLMERSHAPVFAVVYGAFRLPAEPSGCDRDHLAGKTENICSLGLYRKSLQKSAFAKQTWGWRGGAVAKAICRPGSSHFLACCPEQPQAPSQAYESGRETVAEWEDVRRVWRLSRQPPKKQCGHPWPGRAPTISCLPKNNVRPQLTPAPSLFFY